MPSVGSVTVSWKQKAAKSQRDFLEKSHRHPCVRASRPSLIRSFSILAYISGNQCRAKRSRLYLYASALLSSSLSLSVILAEKAVWNTTSLPLFPCRLWPQVVIQVRFLCIRQIDLVADYWYFIAIIDTI